MSLRLSLAGALVGLLVGLTGMGGGSLMTPILIALGLPTGQAIGTDLLFAAVTKTLGALQHARYQQIRWRVVLWLAIGSLPASFAGALCVSLLIKPGEAHSTILQRSLGLTNILVAIASFFRDRFTQKVSENENFNKPLAIILGAALGFLVGFTSIGAGTLFILGLLILFRLPSKSVVGTDVAHGALLVWSAAAAHLLLGNVQVGTVGWLLLGSLPSAL